MNAYELIYAARPDISDADQAKVIEKATAVVAAGGGQLTKVDKWGRQKLAFTVKKCSEAVFTYVEFNAGPEAAKELDRNLKVNELILRYLIVRKDESKKKIKPIRRRPKIEEKTETQARVEETGGTVANAESQ